MEHTTHSGIRLAYSVFGDPNAPPLIMLRGLARTSRHWGAILGELERSFHLILMDNRGIGASDVPRWPWSISDMADDTRAVLDAVDVESAHVFGVSLGGMIAQEFALRHRPRVRTVTLGCTRAGGDLAPRMTWRALVDLLGPMRYRAEVAVRETAPLILSRPFLEAHPEIVDEWVRLAREVPPDRRGVLGQLLAAARFDSSRRIRELRVPTLIVTGDADRLIDAENSRRMAGAIPGAELVILPGAGHDFPTERAAETAALLRRFCLSNGT